MAIYETKLRLLVLALALIETALFLYYYIGGWLDALPFAKGYGGEAMFFSSLVFVPFVLPGLICGVLGRGLHFALIVLAIAGMIFAYDPLLRLGANLGGLPVTLLYAVGILALAGGGFLYLRKS